MRWRDMTREDRFWAKVDKRGPDECWLWTGVLYPNGYGRFQYVRRQHVRAHRFAYELLIGPIPEGLVIDHVKERGCTSRACVNPAHLEPVTNRENILRGDAPSAVAARKSHCPHGHEYTSENTMVRKDGARACKTCRHARDNARYARSKGVMP